MSERGEYTSAVGTWNDMKSNSDGGGHPTTLNVNEVIPDMAVTCRGIYFFVWEQSLVSGHNVSHLYTCTALFSQHHCYLLSYERGLFYVSAKYMFTPGV